jgi:hypothetical protein
MNYAARKSVLQGIFAARYHAHMENPPAVKRSRGRPKKVEGGAVVSMNVRMSEAQREKVRKNGGGDWVRELIDSAPNKR